MNFQAFREQHSTDEPQLLYSTPRSREMFDDIKRFLYIVPNESEIKSISSKLRELPGSDAFYGVIGGVDAALEYLSVEAEKNPRLETLLVDINNDAIEFRVRATDNAGLIYDYDDNPTPYPSTSIDIVAPNCGITTPSGFKNEFQFTHFHPV